MIDIDRAIHIVRNRACQECDPTNSDWNCAECDEAVTYAVKGLELLKERTPVKPKSKSRRGTGGQIYEHRCGKCNSRLFGKQKFCSYCGREVKWK